jgi:xylulokinase
MRTLILGIDSGTQSTKVLVVDAKDGKVLASAAQEYDLIPDLPPGAKEQHPHTWRDATASGIRRALRQAKAVASEVKAIGVSGQQHGFVPLDAQGEVIRAAKLWCDTSTAPECDQIMAELGGLKKTIKALGNAVLPGFTASKILWLKNHEPKNFARLATILLPHDYLNYWLTGQKVMEYGDASGNGPKRFLRRSIRRWLKSCRRWCPATDPQAHYRPRRPSNWISIPACWSAPAVATI